MTKTHLYYYCYTLALFTNLVTSADTNKNLSVLLAEITYSTAGMYPQGRPLRPRSQPNFEDDLEKSIYYLRIIELLRLCILLQKFLPRYARLFIVFLYSVQVSTYLHTSNYYYDCMQRSFHSSVDNGGAFRKEDRKRDRQY